MSGRHATLPLVGRWTVPRHVEEQGPDGAAATAGTGPPGRAAPADPISTVRGARLTRCGVDRGAVAGAVVPAW